MLGGQVRPDEELPQEQILEDGDSLEFVTASSNIHFDMLSKIIVIDNNNLVSNNNKILTYRIGEFKNFIDEIKLNNTLRLVK